MEMIHIIIYERYIYWKREGKMERKKMVFFCNEELKDFSKKKLESKETKIFTSYFI